MSIRERDIQKTNLIGKKVSVVNSPNPSLIGKKGTIVDETKNTLRIKNKDSKEKEHTLIKDQVTIDICGTRIEGQDLVKQATDRIKMKK